MRWEENIWTHDHSTHTQDAAAYKPLGIANSTLQDIGPAYLRSKCRSDITECYDALGC
jgi:hypothetical protein